MSPVFDHEKLNVYQRSLDFVEFMEEVLARLPKSLAAHSVSADWTGADSGRSVV